jgi:lipopolysaccharide/colanic/teichoic acid biosynthesis glycosyltransferase
VDLLAAVILGLVLLPLVLGIAVIVRWRLGSPVLFRQVRSGLDAKPFTIVKFRTMRPERFPGEPDADRLGRLGLVLRASSLDELPQLWNVLRGDMSIIGPRPTLPDQVAHYSRRQLGRLAVRPGVTGWVQVTSRNSLSWPERIEADLWYIKNRSLRLDLRILAMTFLRLVRPTGVTAEGGVNPGFPVPAEAAPPRPPVATATGEPDSDRDRRGWRPPRRP